MGRQISVAMTLEDERDFLAFLQDTAVISLYRSWSPKPAPVASFVEDDAASQFWIHNHAFPWEPKFERVNYEDRDTGSAGTYFRLIDRHAPVIEYSRHSLSANHPQVSGRLYWSKLFLSQPQELAYDIKLFDSWFTTVMRWIRRNGTKVHHGDTEPWCLAQAQIRLHQRE